MKSLHEIIQEIVNSYPKEKRDSFHEITREITKAIEEKKD